MIRGIVTLTNKNNVTISGITFNVNVANAITAITSYGHDTLTITDCGFTGISTLSLIELDGQHASASFNNTIIKNNRFYSASAINRSIHLYPRLGNIVERTKIINNHFEGTKGPAIYIDDYDVCRSTLIRGNTFKNLIHGGTSTTPGVGLFAGLANLNYQIKDTVFTNNHYYNTLTTSGHEQGMVYVYAAVNTIITNNSAVGSWTTSQNTAGPCIAPGRINTPLRGLIIKGNYIEGFDAAWDPDSMQYVEVSDNIVYACGTGFDLGYGTQKYVKIHHNIHYNSSHRTYNAFLVCNNSTPVKCEITDNSYIDDRGTPTATKVIEYTGNFNFSDVQINNNRFYCPSGTLTFITKELGSETQSTYLENNEVHDSAANTREVRNANGVRVNTFDNNWYYLGYNGTTQYFGIRRNSNGYLEVQSFSGQPMSLNPQGNNVAIGGSSADEKLHVHGNIKSSGTGTFAGDVTVPDEAYGAGWNGSLEVPTKNAVYDKIETISAGGISDGDKGNITVSGSGAIWTIDNGVVSLAKMADMATASLLGRNTAGTGVPEVLSAATAKSLLSLNNVDNTSDATKNAASVTLTNKTINADNNTITNIGSSEITADIITGLTAETSIADSDVIMLYDASATALRKMTKANFVSGLGSGSTTKHALHYVPGQISGGTDATTNTTRTTAIGNGGSLYVTSYLPPTYAGNGITVDIWWAVDTDGDTAHTHGWSVSIMRLQTGTDNINTDSFAAANSASSLNFGAIRRWQKTSIAFTSGAQMDSAVAGEAFRVKITSSTAISGNVLVGEVIVRET